MTIPLIGHKQKETTPFESMLIDMLMGMQNGPTAMRAARAATMADIIMKRMGMLRMTVISTDDLVAINSPEIVITESALKAEETTKQEVLRQALVGFGAAVGQVLAEQGLALMTEHPGTVGDEPATAITMQAHLFARGYGQLMAQRSRIASAVKATHPGGNA